MATVRVLRGQPVTLTHEFVLGGEEALNPDTGKTVTVSVSRLDGTAVATGTATAPDNPPGAHTYTLAGQADLDILVAQWSTTINGAAVTEPGDVVEIVGGFFFTLAEGRAVDSVLSNATRYPTADLAARRIEVEDEAEGITCQAWVHRFWREVLDGCGDPRLIVSWPLVRRIRSISVRPTPDAAFVAMSADQVARVAPTADGVLRLDDGRWPAPTWWSWGATWPAGRANILIEFEHGADRPTPDIVRGAKIRFKSLLLQGQSKLPDRAERIATTDIGTVLLASPRPDRVGIPEVDAAYGRTPTYRPGFA